MNAPKADEGMNKYKKKNERAFGFQFLLNALDSLYPLFGLSEGTFELSVTIQFHRDPILKVLSGC